MDSVIMTPCRLKYFWQGLPSSLQPVKGKPTDQSLPTAPIGEIRTVTIDGEPWFVGKDVAAALGYANERDALEKHVDEEDKRVIQRSEIATFEIPNRGLVIITESGLYSLVLSSKLPTARQFKRWATSLDFWTAVSVSFRSVLKPWFVGKDVAAALGYGDTDQALRNHVDEEDKLTRRFDGSGQNREMYIITESGLYSLVLSSKLPTAKAFKRWVTSEVLPSIRKRRT